MKPVTKTTYQCDHCHNSHPTPEAAIECEAKCAEDKEAKRVNNILSKFFKSKRDKYEIRCGDCDKVIVKYEVDSSDPHRNERGKPVIQNHMGIYLGQTTVSIASRRKGHSWLMPLKNTRKG